MTTEISSLISLSIRLQTALNHIPFVDDTNFFFTITKIQNKISSGQENKKMYEFYSNWHHLSSTINPVGSLAIENAHQNFIGFKFDRLKGLLSNSDTSTAIFKSGNGECENGNGERGLFKMGNL